MSGATFKTANTGLGLDPWVVLPAITLLSLGLIMVASASMPTAARELGNPFYYVERQTLYALLGLIAVAIGVFTPLKVWERSSGLLLLLGLVLLLVVLIPGLGVMVNGSRRWLNAGPLTLQASEVARLCMFVYLAAYLARRQQEVETSFSAFARPMFLLAIMCLLLLAEPDFGAAAVLSGACLVMLFMGGARWRDFLMFVGASLAMFAALAWTSPYRMERLTGFMNPWADPFDSGFQLTQALMAIGRGGWFGVGLGEGIQKLFYLPEAHTDFVFAVLAEELGLMGTLAVILLRRRRRRTHHPSR